MKTNVIFLNFLVCCACFFTACDKGYEYFPQWEGEYEAVERNVQGVYTNGDTYIYELSHPETPLNIFQDRGLYVQTIGIGDPFIPGVDKEEHMLYARSPKRIDLMKKDSIENIVLWDSSHYELLIIDGKVYTAYQSHLISPKPIRVSEASLDNLKLNTGSTFDIALVDMNGNVQDTVHCHWEYSPIQKQDENISWVAELHFQSNQSQLSVVRHRFELKKK